jgi:endonuclease/exonuclease/phosphatase (EEP) superfamily protein YafD
MLAPWIPYLELINHFRPYLLVAAAALAGLAWRFGETHLRSAGAAFFTLTLVLALLPLAYGAAGAAGRAPFLRVVTFNLWVSQARLEDTIRFLREADADVIVLQEAVHAGRIVTALRDAYPHVGPCPDDLCEVRLLARHPFGDAGRVARSDANPPLVWVRFERDGLTHELVGVHVAYPFEAERQQAHTEWLSTFLAQRRHPLVLAGDLNLTPFSWKLAKLALSAGLRRHGTWRMSYPAHEWLPYVLLDNVLSTPDFATVAFRTGPRLGSDHLPVIADLALVRR